MLQETLRLQRDGAIAVLTFRRPKAHNALDSAAVAAALEIVGELQGDTEVKVLIVTGAGKSFIAGADIAEMRDKTPDQARAYSELGHQLMRSIEELDKPVISAINGYCLGGGMEIALACDVRIASQNARFGLPETILGIVPGWGALPRATRLIGPAATKELIFTGDLIDAERAFAIGLVNRVVAPEELNSTVMEAAEKVCRQSRFAIARAKAVINASLDTGLPEACAMETEAFVACFEAEDHVEGLQAFLEKRSPSFS